MAHLFNGGLNEQTCEQVISLVIAVKVEIHVLVYGGKFVGNCLVKQFNTFFMHS
jgi:hypothetical protein